MDGDQTIQLGEICERIGVRERDARYVLERGHIPKGVDRSPDSGTYRRFGPGQAFWISVVLKLKEFGIPASLAARIADYTEQSLRTVTHGLGWDWRFSPMRGDFDTQHEYQVEVGDLRYIRFGTDARPGARGRLEYFDWRPVAKPGVPVEGLRPCVVIRLDLSAIARLLVGAFGRPDRSLTRPRTRV